MEVTGCPGPGRSSFAHDASFPHRGQQARMLRDNGFEWYGRWWRLCEIMSERPEKSIEISDESMGELAGSLGFTGSRCGSSGEQVGEVDQVLEFLDGLAAAGLVRPLDDGAVSSRALDAMSGFRR